MAEPLRAYDLAAIRELLLAAFTPEELRRFLQDRSDLRPILNRIGPSDGLQDMVDEVIEYCEQQLLIDDLLREVRDDNPRQYERFEPRLRPAPDSSEGPPSEGRQIKSLSELRDQLRTKYEEGQQAREAGDLKTAQNLLYQSYTEYDVLGDREGMAASGLALGQVLHELGELEEAKEYLQQSRSQFQWLRDRTGLAACLLSLGLVSRERGDASQARSHLEQARNYFENLDDHEGLLATLMALAQLTGDGDYLEQAAELVRQQEDPPQVTEGLLALARLARDMGLGDLAGMYLEQAAELVRQREGESQRAEGLLALGRLARDTGLPELARIYLEESLPLWSQLGDDTRTAETELQLGQILLHQGRPNEAAPHVDKSLELFQALSDQAGIAEGLRALGRIALARGELDIAERNLRQSRDLAEQLGDERGLVESLFWLGVMDFYNNDHYSALTGFDEVLERSPEHAEAFAWRGRTHLVLDSPTAALDDFDRAIELDPTAVGLLPERAECYRQVGRTEEAIADLERFLEQEPDDQRAQDQLAELRRMRVPTERPPDEAADEPADEPGAVPTGTLPDEANLLADADEQLAAGRQALDQGQPDLARKAFQDASDMYSRAENTPGMAESLENLGRAELELEHYEAARDAFQNSRELYGRARDREGIARAAVGSGDAALELEDHEGALSSYDVALRLQPDLAPAYAGRAWAQFHLGRYEDALTDGTEALSRNSADSRTHLVKALAYRGLGQNEESLHCLNNALNIAPQDAHLYTERGETYRLLDNDAAAGADFDHAVELAPEEGWAYARRGEYHRRAGRFREALADFDLALTLGPDDEARVHTQRGETYVQMGNLQAGLAAFDQALALDTDYAWAYARRGEAYYSLGEFQAAREDLQRALDLTPDDPSIQRLLNKLDQELTPDAEPMPSLTPELEAEPEAEVQAQPQPEAEGEAPEPVPSPTPEPEPEPGAQRRIWIVVAKPEQFNWEDALRAFAEDPDRPPIKWTGVSQSASQNRLKQARPGDHVLAYVSTSPVSYITGLGEIVKGPYEFIPEPDEPDKKRSVVDIVPRHKFPQGITLPQLKEQVPTLEKARVAQISFTEVEPHEWAVIRRLILEANPDAGLEEVLPAAPPDVQAREQAPEPVPSPTPEPEPDAEAELEPEVETPEPVPSPSPEPEPEAKPQTEAKVVPEPEVEEEAEIFVPPTREAVPKGEAATDLVPEATGPAAPEPVEPEALEPPTTEMLEDLTHLQVDAAAPERVQVDKAFRLAVWVRRPSQPKLDTGGLERVETGDLYVDWPEEQTYVQLRVEVSAPDCDIDGEASQTFRMPRLGDPPVFHFHLTPRLAGEIGIIVRVYQEENCLGTAQLSTQAEDHEVGHVEVRIVSQAVPIILWGDNPPPDPPAKDHRLTIEVGPELVKLRLPGDEPYCSPLKVDHDALENDENLTAEDIGEILFDGIIRTKGHEAGGFGKRPTYDGYRKALDQSANRLRVALSLAARLPSYPWECLKDRREDVPLTVSENRPFYRLYGGAHPEPVPARPLRFLFAICNPRDLETEPGQAADPGRLVVGRLPKLEVAKELEIIHLAMKELVDDGLASYRVLERSSTGPVTRETLAEELKADGGYHVLHLLAHGGRKERRGDYALVMENPDGNHDFVYPADLRSTMFEHGLRLIVLSACDSAAPVSATALKSLGLQLVDKGVPAVIAMQKEWPVKAAQVFTQRFYGDLARTGCVDMALAATRYDLYDLDAEGGAWAIPQLVMSRHDGRLFEVDTLRASTVRRPKTQDLDVRDYAGLGAEDPTPRRVARAIEEQLRAHGYGGDPLANAVRAVLAPHLARRPAEPKPLAAGQRRDDLLHLAPEVALHSAKLQDYVEQGEHKLELPPSTYTQIASALNAGKHIILIGAPGTGKTSLAQAVCDYAADSKEHERPVTPGYKLTTATADWTTFDTVGGYVPTQEGTLQFRPGIFLEAVSAAHWLIIDEINRAEIDKAFGELFTLLSGQGVHLPYKVRGQPVRILPPAKPGEGVAEPARAWIPRQATSIYDYVMHPNWRIVGTMNVYDKSTLFQMSFAFMRRFAFVDVDPPEDKFFFYLVDKWLDEQKVPVVRAEGDKACAGWGVCSDIQKHFRRLLHLKREENTDLTGENALMHQRMLGPAIVKDMIEYIGDRHRVEQDEARLHDILGEALLLYVIPQLDGLDYQGIHTVYDCVKDLFEGATDMQEPILARLRLLYPHIHDLGTKKAGGS
jgi:tetratricopeptide (TPR) repeat protein/MoxR-like ATPase